MEQTGGIPLGGMQRNQSGDALGQIQYKILQDLQRSMATLPLGWQQTHDPRDRANRVLQLLTQLRFLQPDIGKCLNIAQGFEQRSLLEADSKEVYIQKLKHKLDEIAAKRQAMAEGRVQPGGVGMPMANNMAMMGNNMANIHNVVQQNGINGNQPLAGFGNGMGGMAGMNMNNGHMSMTNMPMGGVDAQRNFPNQLQRPVQPSQIPQQMLPQQAPVNNLDANVIQGTQTSLQPSNMIQSASQQGPVQPMNLNHTGQGMTEPSHQEIMQVAQAIASRTSEETKENLRMQILENLPEQAREQARNRDPLIRFFFQKAREHILKQRGNQAMQNGSVGTNGHMNNVQRPQPHMGHSAGIDFSSILGQQAHALKSQESGEQVVPASNNANYNTNGPQGMNPQLLTAQGGQQSTNAQVGNHMQNLIMQQEKQQRMQLQNMRAQQAAMAAQRAQLRGQPGGLNAPNALNGGPTAQLSSPAMSMLNRPMAPPGQAGANAQQVQASQTHPNPSVQQPPQPTQAIQQQQQNRPQLMGPSGTNQNSHIQQQPHHPMMGQNHIKPNPQQQQQQQQKLMQLVQSLPLNIREKLNGMTPQDAHEFLLKCQNARRASLLGGQPGVQNMLQNDVNMPASQNGQNNTFASAPSDTSNMMPGYKVTPALPQGAGQVETPAGLQQRLQHQQQNQMRQRAMDIAPFPRPILNQLQIVNMIPQNIQNWGALKEFVRQNQTIIGPGIYDKIINAQLHWFTTRPGELNQWMLALRNNLAAQQVNKRNQLQNAQGAMPLTPNGQAPSAQMVPPNASMQTPMGVPAQGMPGLGGRGRLPGVQPPTPQEVQMYRDGLGANTQHISDETIRQTILKNKMEAYNNSMQPPVFLQQQHQQQQQQQEQQQQQQQQQLHQQQQQQHQQQHQQLQQQQQQQRRPQVQAQQQQVQGRSQPPQQQYPKPQTQPQNQHQPLQQQNTHLQTQQMNAPQNLKMQRAPSASGPNANKNLGTSNQTGIDPNGAAQGNKRPQDGSDDVVEISQPSKFPTVPPPNQPFASHGNLSSQMEVPRTFLSNEQVEKLPPQQRQMYLNHLSQMRSREGVRQPQTQVQESEIKQRSQMMYNEVVNSIPKPTRVELDVNAFAQARLLLKKLWPPLNRVQDTFTLAFRAPAVFDEARIRAVMKAKVLIMQNIADNQGNIKDHLTLSLPQLREIEATVLGYFKDMKMLKDRLDQVKASNQLAPGNVPASGGNAAAQGQTNSKGAQSMTPQDMGRTPSQQNAVRKASTNSKAPPAPTDNKAFEFPSPHGVPKYDSGRAELTQEKLKMPVQKKRRTGQAESPVATPTGQLNATNQSNASPAMSGMRTASPESMRRQQQQLQQQQQQVAREAELRRENELTKYRCKDMLCDASIKGFATEAELKSHMDTMHHAIDDPLAFLLEKAAQACGVTFEGHDVFGNEVLETSQTPLPITKIKEDNSLNVKKEAGVSVTPSLLNESQANDSQGAKATTIVTGKPEKISTMRDFMMNKMGLDDLVLENEEKPTKLISEPSANWSNNPFLAAGLGDLGELDDYLQFAQVHDWDFRPEAAMVSSLTPSEETPQSSETSDISENDKLLLDFSWDPFGRGPTAPPDSSQLQALGLAGLKLSPASTSGTGSAEKDDEVAESNPDKKSNSSKWDWSNDMVLDFDETG